jgi:hypothetical protein
MISTVFIGAGWGYDFAKNELSPALEARFVSHIRTHSDDFSVSRSSPYEGERGKQATRGVNSTK